MKGKVGRTQSHPWTKNWWASQYGCLLDINVEPGEETYPPNPKRSVSVAIGRDESRPIPAIGARWEAHNGAGVTRGRSKELEGSG